MSLNGLDNVKVKEAHDAAIAELGGWFLLKYLSRDEIDLLERGNGGILEIRNAIAQYEEESPLFGFLRYRRRNVLIKYIPEGCSRLVQARATVHFNAVTEKFSPHDTIFPITSSKELKDSTLSAACSLHTASGSTSSSTSSLRKRRLMEIVEDENEDKRQSIVTEERPMTLKELSISGSQSQQASASSTPQSPQLDPLTSFQSMASDGSSLSLPGAAENRPRSPTKSLDGRRISSQSTRPDVYRYSTFGSTGRPKVKLGPRPSLDTNGRPKSSQSSGGYRPVSTLPPGLKLVSKFPTTSKEVAQAQPSNPPPTMTLSPPPLSGYDSSRPQTTILVRPHTSGGRPTTSSGTSMKPPMSPISAVPKESTMTPEKLRLMKALQLRKKQMASSSQAGTTSSPPRDETEIPPVPEIRLSQGPPGEIENKLASLDDMARTDSAIAIEAPSTEKVAASDTARTNSTPGSPTEPSEEAESTQASSVSDSTDETIQEVQNQSAKHSRNSAGDHARENWTEPNEVKDSIIEEAKEPLANSTLSNRKRADDEETGTYVSGQESLRVERQVQDPSAQSDSLPEKEDNDLSSVTITTAAVPPKEQITRSEDKKSESRSMPKGDDLEVRASDNHLDEADKTELLSREQAQSLNIKESVEAVQTESPPRQLRIPRSKFSMQPIEPSEVAKSAEEPDLTGQELSSNSPKSPVGSTFSSETKRSATDDEQDGSASRQARKKRRGLVDPISTDISVDKSGPNSETDLLSDDDFMNELQSATVQEAKPISVSKSPISPVFSRDAMKTPNEGNRFSRAFSNPLRKDSFKAKMLSPHTPNAESSRSSSASAAFLNRANQQTTLPIVKKVNLGSGISQRIKALEKLSSSAAGPTPPPGTTGSSPVASPAFFSVGKPRSRAGSKSPSIVERSESLTRMNTSPTVSCESSPEALKFRDRSGSIQSRREAFNSPLTTQPVRSRPESISVTARIIRDPNQPFPLKPEAGKDSLDFTPLDLQQSPLVIDHQKAIVAPPSPHKETILERRLSNPPKDLQKERRSSISIVKDLINDRRSSLADRRMSISIEPPGPSPARSSRPPSTNTTSPNATRPRSVSSRRSSTSGNLPTSLSSLGLSSVSLSTVEDSSDKKSGRASRMLRLISGPFSASRKSLAHGISPTLREESEPPNASLRFPQFRSVEIGDVNVQFPDNLLWKRRSMSIDSQGFLVLSQAQSNKGTEKSMAVKRYHLSDFRTPFVPEMEVQELPNSVVLDFIDGGGLQVAVEDRGGQMRLLEVMLEAHRSYSAYGR